MRTSEVKEYGVGVPLEHSKPGPLCSRRSRPPPWPQRARQGCV